MSRRFLIIQTAFTGDAILLTSLLEKLYKADSGNKIDILVRKGNESLFLNHPYAGEVLIWDKKKNKYANLFRLLSNIRKRKYDVVVNLQRFLSTGILTAFSSAKETSGFNKNPLSFLFTKKIKHSVNNGLHEIDRNQLLVKDYTDEVAAFPRLYPSTADFNSVERLKHDKYITISPISVWFTKTVPAYKWIDLIKSHRSNSPRTKIYLLGAKNEFSLAEFIKEKSGEENIENLCGSLSFLESAALILRCF